MSAGKTLPYLSTVLLHIERKFNYLNCLSSRTCGARRPHVGLCPSVAYRPVLLTPQKSLKLPTVGPLRNSQFVEFDNKIKAIIIDFLNSQNINYVKTS